MAKLLERTTEWEEEFKGSFVFGYFDSIPTQEEAACAYFEGDPPDGWKDFPELARVGDPPPQQRGDRWRVLLGEDC